MIQTVEKDKMLLVDGPACVQLLSGKTSVLGAPIKTGERVVVRKGKRVAIEALTDSRFELTLGDSASCAKTGEGAVPSSWRDACAEILSRKGRKTVLVLGRADSGKTSFCTYLVNSALNMKQQAALIDGDLGQSDIGSPGTIGLTVVREPVTDLFTLWAEEFVFLRVTSPSKKVSETIDALATLKRQALERDADFLVVNTDGWAEGEEAASYKVRLVRTVAPDFVVAIQGESELASVIEALSDLKTLAVDSPKNIKNRDRETRKLLRESAYRKYLKEGKVRSFPLSWVGIEGDLKLNTVSRNQSEGTSEERSREEAPHEGLSTEQEAALREGDEEGLLVGLQNGSGRFLGIGTICNIDPYKRFIRVYTPVEEPVSKIKIGRIILDRAGNEVGLI